MEDEIKVTLTEVGSTPNLFVWDGPVCIAKIWLYPDGSITYKSFRPDISQSVTLRRSHHEVYDPKENL